MTLERDTRCGMFGTPLWVMLIAKPDGTDRRPRRLVLEPYSPLSLGTATRLDAWVEEQQGIYVWESTKHTRRPTGAPTWRTEWRRIDASVLHGCPGLPSMGFAVIRALARQELVGESAKEVMHDLFWSAFVANVDGLNYLVRYADKDTGTFYARQQFDWQINQLKRAAVDRRKPDGDKDPVAELLAAVVREEAPMLGLRAWERAVVDDTFYDALAAIAATPPGDERDASTLAFLKLHKSKRIP